MAIAAPVLSPKDAAAPTGAAPLTSASLQPCSLADFVLYFLRLGTLGFGGRIALAGYMQRDLVYLGWVKGGVLGATWVGLAFVLIVTAGVLGCLLRGVAAP